MSINLKLGRQSIILLTFLYQPSPPPPAPAQWALDNPWLLNYTNHAPITKEDHLSSTYLDEILIEYFDRLLSVFKANFSSYPVLLIIQLKIWCLLYESKTFASFFT